MEVDLFGDAVSIDTDPIDAPHPAIRRQIEEYRAGARRRFDLPVAIPDSFTGLVMEAIGRIPYGETRTYGEIAADLDTAPIAVGQACGRNPVPIVIPCHRVVASDGLGGYGAGSGIALKRRLLGHEAA